MLLYDTGANVNLVNSVDLFERMDPCVKNIKVKGVGMETLKCEGTGTLLSALAGVTAMYIPELKVSIISESVIDKFCDIDRIGILGAAAKKIEKCALNREKSVHCVTSRTKGDLKLISIDK